MMNISSRNKYITVIVLCLALLPCLTGCSDDRDYSSVIRKLTSATRLSSEEDINLRSDDGTNYTFTYDGEDFHAEYSGGSWEIYNSYRITSSKDITTICTALSEEHPVLGKDYESYRTPKDMAFEWVQHNIAYQQLPDGNSWKESARNVDLDPEDQGKTFKEIYEERTGKELDLDTVLSHKDKIRQKIKEKLKEYLN